MAKQKLKLFFVFCACFIAQVLSAPSDQTLVVSSTVPPKEAKSGKEGENVQTRSLQIYQMYIESNIHNRFAHTTVTCKVKNYADKAQEAVFTIILPESAFISGFVMEVEGKNYTAYVKEKEEAKRVYDQAVASGFGAAHVAVSARDSNRFTVSVNIQSGSKAAFYLNYEELLKRKNGHYEQIINIHPGQPVKDLNLKVIITESKKIIDLRAPPMRSGNEIGTDKPELDPRADLEIVNDTTAIVTFSPNLERQKELAHVFGTNVEDGLAGQFVVQYDVERDAHGGEVLIQDGYFVHFFAPSDLKPIPKQMVFVLDTSGSMHGEKIQQLKEAMINILSQLKEHDSFNLVEFNSNTKVWDLDNMEKSVWYPRTNTYYYNYYEKPESLTLEKIQFPTAYVASNENIHKAKLAIGKLKSDGSTSMYAALQVGLRLVELERYKTNDIKRQPIVVFLTDGDPTDLSTTAITTKITEFNSEARKAPIITLSFGGGADKKFLQQLSLRNSGFSRHIYEGADASLQLEDFYQQISLPLLSDVTFKYEPSITSLTITEFPIHFGGSEIVVAGYCGIRTLAPEVKGIGKTGPVSFKPVVTTTVSNIERLWAYLTIKQLLDKKESAETDTDKIKKEALNLALKYKFVTPVSSLVVVKPNETNSVDAEEAKGNRGHHQSSIGFSSGMKLSAGAYGPPRMPVQHGPPGMSSLPGLASGMRHSGGAYGPLGIPGAYGPPGIPGAYGPPQIPGAYGAPGMPGAYRPLGIPGPYGPPGMLGSYGPPQVPGVHRAPEMSGAYGPPGIPGSPAPGNTVYYAMRQPTYVYPRRPGASGQHSASLDRSGPPGQSGYTYPSQRPIFAYTTLPPKNLLQRVLSVFPWLNSILTDGIVKGPTGSYKLGLNETISVNVACPKATNDKEGHCTLLHNCLQASLPTVTDYYNHFCILRNEFAGVCCPKLVTT